MNIHPASLRQLPSRHLLETQQFNLSTLDTLFELADKMREGWPCLHGKIMCSLFYQPSTRTRLSFESAMLRLGGGYIGTDNAREFSSTAKGESLEDTIRVVGKYAHVIVLRHHESHAAKRAAAVSAIPVINAGCGTDQHPTQALLDVYTIRQRLGRIENLRVAMMGDLKHGRTVHSLAYLLGKYPGVELFFVSPEGLELPQNMRMHFHEHGVRISEFRDLEDIIDLVDVLYVTRVQLEHMHEEDRLKYERSYRLHRGLAQRMRENSIIMHPLPRNDEISTDVDTLPGAVYLDEQVESGLLVRMAILKTLLA